MNLHILLVEDHADTRVLLKWFLQQEGHEVSAVGDMRSALAAAEGRHFDVLLSDLDLPDGDGCDLMRSLRSNHPIQGAALTGFDMADDLRRSRDAGFDWHLVKPVYPESLQGVLEECTRRAAQLAKVAEEK